MRFLYNIFASYITTYFLIIVYIFLTAAATFIESFYGTSAARYWVYDASYFDLLNFLLVLNMLAVSYKVKLYNRKKFTIFLFHFGFIVVIFGAAITRFMGYKGDIHIREGEVSNFFTSTTNFLKIKMNDGNYVLNYEIPVKDNNLSSNFSRKFTFNKEDYTVRLKKYIPNAVQKVIYDKNGDPVITFLFSTEDSRRFLVLKKGETKFYQNVHFSFTDKVEKGSFNFIYKNDSLFFSFSNPVYFFSMSGSDMGIIPADSLTFFNPRLLYHWDKNMVALKDFTPKGKVLLESDVNQSNAAALIFDFTGPEDTKEILVWSQNGNKGLPSFFQIGKNVCSISYGPKKIKLPFYIKLDDFQLERYSGSESPKSYKSYVTLIDTSLNQRKSYLISMNNVLEYKGYRFYQSSYDPDEKGTILTVNHDFWGTFFTYIGYALLAIGMFLSLFNKNSRLHYLARKLNSKGNKLTLFFILFITTTASFSQSLVQLPEVKKRYAEKFGSLYIKAETGRIEPVNTFTTEILLKLTHRSSFEGLTPNQVLLSMLINPERWTRVPLIKVKNEILAKRFNAVDNFIPLSNFFDNKGNYILSQEVNAINRKNPASRNELDREILKLDEKANILYETLNLLNLNIFPDKLTGKWYTPTHSEITNKLFSNYVTSLKESSKTKNWKIADSALEKLIVYQKNNMDKSLVDEDKKKAEIFYYKVSIFRHLFEFYFTIGFIYLTFLFLKILFERIKLDWLDSIIRITIYVAFVIHTLGLGLRWYISNHAPWSNGYESMIYIAWATLLSGIIFSGKNKLVLGGTTFLAGVTLLVAHLSWMDPQITNLVPVLQSYWLTIHVAVITASYGFLGLGAIIGLLVLILMIFVSQKNRERIASIILELSYINEMSLIVGLYLLTIGTFIGGVWANQSWGTYWSWDPKETWSLITILVYALVLHIRLIPSLKSVFSFNLLSFLSISSIIMTFFGVNYYLTGLHSYAGSIESTKIPSGVYYTIIIVLGLSILAYNKYKEHLKELRNIKSY